jgi:hypothetical protein
MLIWVMPVIRIRRRPVVTKARGAQEFRSGGVMLVATKIHLWRRPTTAGLSRNVFAHERTYPPNLRGQGGSEGGTPGDADLSVLRVRRRGVPGSCS